MLQQALIIQKLVNSLKVLYYLVLLNKSRNTRAAVYSRTRIKEIMLLCKSIPLNFCVQKQHMECKYMQKGRFIELYPY